MCSCAIHISFLWLRPSIDMKWSRNVCIMLILIFSTNISLSSKLAQCFMFILQTNDYFFHSKYKIKLGFLQRFRERGLGRWHVGDKDDTTCFGAVSLIPSSPYSPLRVRAPSTKWENSSFDGALSRRARPMRTSSQFAPQTRELPRTTIRSSTSCRFSLSKEGAE